MPEFDQDLTQDIRDALNAQGYTISFMGNTATYDQLVRIILRDISVTGGPAQALVHQVNEAIDWARVNNIRPRPVLNQKPTPDTTQDVTIISEEGGRVMTTLTAEQLESAIDGVMFASMVPPNLSASAVAAMGALAAAAGAGGWRWLAVTPLFLSRWGIPLGTLEVIDILTPGIDIPTVSDVPRAVADLLRGSGATVHNEELSELSTIERILNFLLPGDPFGSNGANPFTVGQVFMQNQIVKTWEANGVWFARQADGLNWVQRKNGTIKSFRNVRPIVLTSSGASTPKIAERALKALYNQYKGMRKAFKPFDKPAPRRAPARRDWSGDNVTQIRN